MPRSKAVTAPATAPDDDPFESGGGSINDIREYEGSLVLIEYLEVDTVDTAVRDNAPVTICNVNVIELGDESTIDELPDGPLIGVKIFNAPFIAEAENALRGSGKPKLCRIASRENKKGGKNANDVWYPEKPSEEDFDKARAWYRENAAKPQPTDKFSA